METTVRWSLELPGVRPGGIAASPDGSAVLVADGWGVAYRSLTLRRLGLCDGSLQVERRLGDSARCYAFDASGENFIAAFDKRLRLMQAESLDVLELWDRRIPRSTNGIVWSGRRVLLRNGSVERANVFDLDSGRTRRVVLGEIGGDLLHELPNGQVIAGGTRRGEGTVWVLDSLDARPRPLIATPPVHSIAVSKDGSIWAAPGVPRIETVRWNEQLQGPARIGMVVVGPGLPARELLRYDGPHSDRLTVRTPRPFRVVSVGRGELWIAGARRRSDDPPVVERLRLVDLEWLPALHAPRGHSLAAMLPQVGVAFSGRFLDANPKRYELACLASAD